MTGDLTITFVWDEVISSAQLTSLLDIRLYIHIQYFVLQSNNCKTYYCHKIQELKVCIGALLLVLAVKNSFGMVGSTFPLG
jgi:hypothetical protein